MPFSERFQLKVVFTAHALDRMRLRDMPESLVMDIIETGVDKDAGRGHHWLYKQYADRDDNLLCVAAVIEDALVVKTVMHHWEIAP